ncbi:hypothetical protein Slala02_31810 [Streptomyces lavendulae subsp. lavendulae]|nr:hypothetical protein Slala01_38480 [Streptomyces lavendulae subsp. lavendulae]GLX27361.1 hypothetical protein Slala02_31810 [Streptomyces lavendulae subsp. lavendulae]
MGATDRYALLYLGGRPPSGVAASEGPAAAAGHRKSRDEGLHGGCYSIAVLEWVVVPGLVRRSLCLWCLS